MDPEEEFLYCYEVLDEGDEDNEKELDKSGSSYDIEEYFDCDDCEYLVITQDLEDTCVSTAYM